MPDVNGADGARLEGQVADQVVEIPVLSNLRNLAVGQAEGHVGQLAQHPAHLVDVVDDAVVKDAAGSLEKPQFRKWRITTRHPHLLNVTHFTCAEIKTGKFWITTTLYYIGKKIVHALIYFASLATVLCTC